MRNLIHKVSNIKVIYRILNSYKKSSVDKFNKKYVSFLKADKKKILYDPQKSVYPNNSFLDRLVYKNEEWEVVKNRFHDRFLKFFNFPVGSNDNICSDKKTRIVGDTLYFDSEGLTDDWIYLYLKDYSLINYELKFDAVFYSSFREIQFGFRYIDFYNRYRFRIENGFLHFDIIKKGQFYNSLFVEPFLIRANENYSFLILVKDDKFSFLSNGRVLMTITDPLNLFTKGGIAFILWEDCGESNIKGAFKSIQFNSII